MPCLPFVRKTRERPSGEHARTVASEASACPRKPIRIRCSPSCAVNLLSLVMFMKSCTSTELLSDGSCQSPEQSWASRLPRVLSLGEGKRRYARNRARALHESNPPEIQPYSCTQNPRFDDTESSCLQQFDSLRIVATFVHLGSISAWSRRSGPARS